MSPCVCVRCPGDEVQQLHSRHLQLCETPPRPQCLWKLGAVCLETPALVPVTVQLLLCRVSSRSAPNSSL